MDQPTATLLTAFIAALATILSLAINSYGWFVQYRNAGELQNKLQNLINTREHQKWLREKRLEYSINLLDAITEFEGSIIYNKSDMLHELEINLMKTTGQLILVIDNESLLETQLTKFWELLRRRNIGSLEWANARNELVFVLKGIIVANPQTHHDTN